MIPYDMSIEELIKEVYARFGLAYYHSDCLHRELCHIYAFFSFQDPKVLTKARIEEKLANAYSLTLGQVKDEIRDLIPEELYKQLDEAVNKRNFLAHHFWFERAHLMHSISGLIKMIEELEEYSILFHEMDEQASEFMKPKFKQLGVTDEIFQICFKEIVAGKPWDPLPRKRKLKKRERLIRVWEFELPDGSKPMIFETENGELWQLCDVGLGWTYYEEIGADWKENERIKPYLPANINPRPKVNGHWDYEFELKNNTLLFVKPGKREKTFKWNLKKKGEKKEDKRQLIKERNHARRKY